MPFCSRFCPGTTSGMKLQRLRNTPVVGSGRAISASIRFASTRAVWVPVAKMLNRLIGCDRGPAGPLSHPINLFSIFATGTQTALVDANLIDALIARPDPTTGVLRSRCSFIPDVVPGQNRLQNGIQIFSGGEPIY